MGEAVGITPAKTDTLAVPSGTSTQRLFDCAESSIRGFASTDSNWLPVVRKDVSGGVLESEDFDAGNVVGFRVRIVRKDGSDTADLDLKGAGPYFMDLGVDGAVERLKASIGACLGG